MRNWLKELRVNKNLTQEETASRCRITQGYYSMIEKGVRGKAIPLKTVNRLAKVLDFPVERFYQSDDEGV